MIVCWLVRSGVSAVEGSPEHRDEARWGRYSWGMADGVPWTMRRKLFLVETIIFLACIIGGLVILLTGHGYSHALEGAVFLFAVILIHLALRLTYFKQVLPEIRRQRTSRSD
jgi:lysylphosphatidylglycerol synthetase-like protein (DUF2156 family)